MKPQLFSSMTRSSSPLLQQSNGHQPIHVAALMGQKVMVKTLVEKYKAKFDCCDFVS